MKAHYRTLATLVLGAAALLGIFAVTTNAGLPFDDSNSSAPPAELRTPIDPVEASEDEDHDSTPPATNSPAPTPTPNVTPSSTATPTADPTADDDTPEPAADPAADDDTPEPADTPEVDDAPDDDDNSGPG